MSQQPSLHTALQREREITRKNRDASPICNCRWCTDRKNEIEAAQHSTDQALAALEERPTWEELEGVLVAMRGTVAQWDGATALDRITAALGALYARGGVT